MTDDAHDHRWGQILDTLTDVITPPGHAGSVYVVIDDSAGHSGVFADQLAAAMHTIGQPCARLSAHTPVADHDAWLGERTTPGVVLADGPRWRTQPPAGRWDIVIYLRTPPANGHRHADAERGADIVIDCHDPRWPVIRHIADHLAERDRWYVAETRAFFAPRAAGWDTKFGDDLPAYTAAVVEAGIAPGAVALDVGCGTGRALPALREAVGPTGTVLGVDLTPQMLSTAAGQGRHRGAQLFLGDARQLPLRAGSIDAIFAAGLVQHLPDPAAGLRELARVTRPSGRLVIFHPSGRAALAARHGRTLRPDEPLAHARLDPLMRATGWRLTHYDDPPHRFLALAIRGA
jgi:SAM-dependent methyltransferase